MALANGIRLCEGEFSLRKGGLAREGGARLFRITDLGDSRGGKREDLYLDEIERDIRDDVHANFLRAALNSPSLSLSLSAPSHAPDSTLLPCRLDYLSYFRTELLRFFSFFRIRIYEQIFCFFPPEEKHFYALVSRSREAIFYNNGTFDHENFKVLFEPESFCCDTSNWFASLFLSASLPSSPPPSLFLSLSVSLHM